MTVLALALTGLAFVFCTRRRMLLALSRKGLRQIYLRRLDSEKLQPLAGTESARTFGSPDCRLVGFFADGKLKGLPATGGAAQLLCEETGFGRRRHLELQWRHSFRRPASTPAGGCTGQRLMRLRGPLIVMAGVRRSNDLPNTQDMVQALRLFGYDGPVRILFVHRKAVVRTSSGKLARRRTRKEWQPHTLPTGEPLR